MADIAQILASVLGGLGQGIGTINEQRQKQFGLDTQRQQNEIQRQQVDQHRTAQEFAQLERIYNTLSPETDIDPQQAQKFSSAGFQLSKSPMGTVRRPVTPQEQLLGKQLTATDLEIQGRQGDLEDSVNTRKFRAALQVEGSGTLQALMQKPTAERDAFWQAQGMSGKAPRNIAELAQEDIAGAAGDRSVQVLQNQGYLNSRMAGMSGLTADDVDPVKFKEFVAGAIANNPKIEELYNLAKTKGTMGNFESEMMQEYRRLFKNMR